MSKIKVSKSDVKNHHRKVLSIGYCQAQTLLKCEAPLMYSCGIYGWACDYYVIDDVIICTGYNPIGKCIDYEIIKKYEKKAEAIDWRQDWQEVKKQHKKLLAKFIKEATKEEAEA